MAEDIYKNKLILVVDDEERMSRFIRLNLGHDGFKVVEANRGMKAIQQIRDQMPDLVLLDVMMPDLDGFEVLQLVRESSQVPVIMLTAKGEEDDRVKGLELGADDYVTKPFSARILVARIKAVLRRSAVEPGDEKETLTQGPFEIDRLHHTARMNGQPLTLTLSEFKALELFAKRPGVVFSRYQIVDAIHGEDYPVTDRSVDVLIVGLRRKLGECGEWIETVRGVGYRMKAE